LARKESDGRSSREHLEFLAERGHPTAIAELEGAECPMALTGLWSVFLDLSAGRTSNGFGPNPLTFAEREAYLRLYDTVLSPWEHDLLTQLDLVYLENVAAMQKEKDKQAKKPTGEG